AGYHFHNLWYQSAVDLGYIGLSLAILTVGITAIEVMRWVLRSSSPASCFFCGFVVFVIVRSTLEVDLFAQFSPMDAIFIAVFVYARLSRERHKAQHRRGGCGRPRSRPPLRSRSLSTSSSSSTALPTNVAYRDSECVSCGLWPGGRPPAAGGW